MQHRLLSAAAAKLGVTASAPAIVAATPAPPVAPANEPAGDVVDVVTLADYQRDTQAQFAAGAQAERERTAAVFASDAGKANPSMAAFLLNTSASASADQIIAHLGAMPSAAAPAPAPAAAAPAPAAPAITTPLAETPRIDVGAAPNAGEAEPKVDAEKFWSTQISAANASIAQPFGGEVAPGIPRTGN